jgi:EAL domain-containing protein (putative c-di-GMP-specific phosphodiesterase class I)/DNA-binding response OmpR family regulator
MTEPIGSDLSVLVVEDDAANRLLLRQAMTSAGFDVVEAGGGEEALRILESRTVGIVVSDVGLPGISGIELVRSLRSRPETAILPIILVTGSGDRNTVIEGLEAGADDFLSKPVRLDELIARVRAHVRTQAAWSQVVQAELKARTGVVAALGSLMVSTVPEETAVAVVTELAQRTDSDFVSVAQVTDVGRMQELATFNRRDGVKRGGETFAPDLASYLLNRARNGPWVDDVKVVGPAEPTAALLAAAPDLVASAPIYADDDLVGLLSIGATVGDKREARSRSAKLLSAAIDYASVLSAVAGSAIAGTREVAAQRAQLRQILDGEEFHIVFQPIVDVESLAVVGFEALTRFDDGVRPDIRFSEAARADLGFDFELAAIRLAVDASHGLPAGCFVSLNLSPQAVIDRADMVREILAEAGRPIVLELTEHVPIDDYEELIAALRTLGDGVEVAVDDAGAGYASLRHILELQPSFAKLDMSLVRGIDTNDLRQALAAGLNYYALRTGCRLIAEGVETEAEAAALSRLGIEFGQGYLYGRPKLVADLDLAMPTATIER